MAKQQTVRKQNTEDFCAESERPASLVALEAQFTKEQVEALRRVAILLAASALKIAREKGMVP
jgi:hypothetical protein